MYYFNFTCLSLDNYLRETNKYLDFIAILVCLFSFFCYVKRGGGNLVTVTLTFI